MSDVIIKAENLSRVCKICKKNLNVYGNFYNLREFSKNSSHFDIL